MGQIGVDVATAISCGTREIQQDSLVTHFPHGSDVGFMVLADGMGGHISGEIASNIVVTEVFAELKFKYNELALLESRIPSILKSAVLCANDCIREYISQNPESYGMGSTVVAAIIVGDRLYWISVGDSPLYLFRDRKLIQLNQDHSLAPEIDVMVKAGILTEEEGRNHPDRNCLRSVIIGSEVAKIDCPETPFLLRPGDIIVASSDGFQTLSEPEMNDLLEEISDRSGHEIVRWLLAAVEEIGNFEQDNTSLAVMKLSEMNVSDISGRRLHDFGRKADLSMESGSTRFLQSV
jgi:protein phosphatase